MKKEKRILSDSYEIQRVINNCIKDQDEDVAYYAKLISVWDRKSVV